MDRHWLWPGKMVSLHNKKKSLYTRLGQLVYALCQGRLSWAPRCLLFHDGLCVYIVPFALAPSKATMTAHTTAFELLDGTFCETFSPGTASEHVNQDEGVTKGALCKRFPSMAVADNVLRNRRVLHSLSGMTKARANDASGTFRHR